MIDRIRLNSAKIAFVPHICHIMHNKHIFIKRIFLMLQMSELAVQKACQSYTNVMTPNVKFQMVTVIRTLG